MREQIRDVYLFGSVLDGYLLPWSDLDLVVVTWVDLEEKERQRLWYEIRKDIYETYACPVDMYLVWPTKLWSLRTDFLDGIRYEVL